jgi:excisionase family DNA binding protein
MSTTGRLLTAREVGELLGLSAETVLDYTRRGELPGFRMPGTARGRLRYREADIEAWLESRATGAADRGVSATRSDRAHGSVDRLRCEASATRPPDAARIEEEP